jgi:hypothetical protein
MGECDSKARCSKAGFEGGERGHKLSNREIQF